MNRHSLVNNEEFSDDDNKKIVPKHLLMTNDQYNLLDPVTTGQEMAAVDRYAIEQIGIPGMVLMENAGSKVVVVIKELFGNQTDKLVTIVAGKGNNGGDGFVIARYLHHLGAEVKVFTTTNPNAARGDAAANLAILTKIGITTQLCEGADFDTALHNSDLIVDAILGTGVSGPLKGKIAKIVSKINHSPAPVIAVDLPTGIETDTGAVTGECVCANHTITMGHLKRGLLFSPGREYAGKVHVVDIGFPPAASKIDRAACFRTTRQFVKQILPTRSPNAYKNNCGKVFTLAGSAGMTGAAALAAAATLKIGAGLSILGIPAGLNVILEQKLTEVMTLPLPETSAQTFSFAAKDQLEEKLNWSDVLAVGPGMTTHAECVELLQWLLNNYDKTIVLDADGLNCLAERTVTIRHAQGDLILTPHPGELARLVHTSPQKIITNPIEAAKSAANELGAIVVLKGGPTVTADPGGEVFINSTGNPGMATAGMGDVLTGVIAGLSAQGLAPLSAAVAGVYLHGLAGDFARDEIGEAGLMANDVLQRIAMAGKSYELKGGNDIEFI